MPGTTVKILLALLFVAALVYATFGQAGVECEACLEYRGRSACRTVTAPDRNQAVAQVTATICAVISGGVTDGMACARTPPTSLSCSE